MIFITVDSTIGMCANASACEENCEAFFEKLLTEGEGNSFLFEIGYRDFFLLLFFVSNPSFSSDKRKKSC